MRGIDLRRALIVAASSLIAFFAVGLARWLYVFDLARREQVIGAFFVEERGYFFNCVMFLVACGAAALMLRRLPRVAGVLMSAISIIAAAAYFEESVRHHGAQIERFGESGHSYFYATWWISGFWLLAVPTILVLVLIGEHRQRT
jgi:hypothetical protein